MAVRRDWGGLFEKKVGLTGTAGDNLEPAAASDMITNFQISAGLALWKSTM